MQGTWKTTYQVIGKEEIYQVYRLKNVHNIDCSENREYAPALYDDSISAQDLANQLNAIATVV